ncbi:hypothetical protein ACFV9E_43175, partial [Streptomyces sp. NPDC059835]|uniref:hypothetical protein n=1 Tax=Streptomyces sp. NPDC059835 TaxID=3346967 RepID=UPI00364A9165
QYAAAAGTLTGIVWDGGRRRFVACSDTRQIAESEDGTSWKAVAFEELPQQAAGIALRAGDQPVFVVAGAKGAMATSSDPLNSWRTRTIPDATKSVSTSVIRSTAGRFLVTAHSGTIFRGSDDGSAWEHFSTGDIWDSSDVHGISEATTQPV